jgi:hypothetical protein
VHLDSARAQMQVAGDVLVGAALSKAVEDVALAGAQGRDGLLRAPGGEPRALLANLGSRSPQGRGEILKGDGPPKQVGGAEPDGADRILGGQPVEQKHRRPSVGGAGHGRIGRRAARGKRCQIEDDAARLQLLVSRDEVPDAGERAHFEAGALEVAGERDPQVAGWLDQINGEIPLPWVRIPSGPIQRRGREQPVLPGFLPFGGTGIRARFGHQSGTDVDCGERSFYPMFEVAFLRSATFA